MPLDHCNAVGMSFFVSPITAFPGFFSYSRMKFFPSLHSKGVCMFMASTRNSARIQQARRAFTYIAPHRKIISVILLLMLVVAAIGALEPLIYKLVFDRLGTNIGIKNLLVGVGAIMATAVAREALNAFSNWLSWKVRLSVNYRLLDTTTARLHALPLSYHRVES